MLDGCAQSPDWTAVDADAYDQMVIRINGGTGGAPLEVQWIRDGEDFGASARTAIFEVRPEAGMTSYVVPLASAGDWAGEVVGLRLAPGFGDWGGKVAIDAVFFQDSADQTTSSADESFILETPVDFIDPSVGEDAGHTEDASGRQDADGTGSPDAQPGPSQGTGSADRSLPSGGRFSGNAGCACQTAANGRPGVAAVIAALVMAMVALRRRQYE